MNALAPPKEYNIGKELTVRNHLDGEVFVALYKGVISVDVSKCRPPVIMTLSPGKKITGLEELKKISGEIAADPIRRPIFGSR